MSSHNKLVDWPANVDYQKQSVAVPGTKKPGQSAHYRNAVWGLISIDMPNALTTCVDIYETGYALANGRPFLGQRAVVSTNPLKFDNKYTWQTYPEVDVRRRAVGSALTRLFSSGELGGGEFDTVGIWSQNRPEWQIIDLALQAYKKVGVSLYDTLGKDSVEYIINHAQLTVIFVTVQHVPILLKLAPQVPTLKMIVSIDNLSAESRNILSAWGDVQKVKVLDLHDIEAMGKANPVEPSKPSPTDVCSLCYTSGTTNNPKGVVLSHGALAMAVQSNLHGSTFEVGKQDEAIELSYLPLAHIYERLNELAVIAVGGRIGFFTGDPLRLLEDAQILKPRFFPSVPRVLNRVYQVAMTSGDVPGLKGAIFRKAIAAKLEKLYATGDNTHPLWDRLVFRKVRAVLGGELKLVSSGSAPISPDVMDFLKIAFACEVLEGYGMTENCGCCTRAWPNDPTSSGTVGPPQPVNEVKLVDVPAMGYTAEDKPNPRGELCVRGWNCFKVYYKDEQNTKETVDPEEWIHTGDVAEIDGCGRVKIIDRVKNIMKLAQGEYVALEKIENVFGAAPLVAQVYVHGDSLQSYLVGVVVPDPEQLVPLAHNILGKQISPQDLNVCTEVIKDPRIYQAFMDMLTKEGKKHGLKGFELIKRIHLSMEPFSIENGTLTPTMKIRRKDAYALYKKELDGLYAVSEGREAPKL